MERYNICVLDLRDIDKIVLRLDKGIEKGRLGELDIFKITLKPEEVKEGYKRYNVDASLDKIVLVGSKKSLARFLAYLIKLVKENDEELYKMFIDAMTPMDYINFELFYETYPRDVGDE